MKSMLVVNHRPIVFGYVWFVVDDIWVSRVKINDWGLSTLCEVNYTSMFWSESDKLLSIS